MRFHKRDGGKSWTLHLFGGKNTYPVAFEFNFWHFGQKVHHGPFYDRGRKGILEIAGADDYWGKKLFPLVWGTGGILKCVSLPDIDVWRLWIYSRWGTICHIDLTINRRGKNV